MCGCVRACECAVGYNPVSRSRPPAAPASNACASVRVRVLAGASVRVRAPGRVCAGVCVRKRGCAWGRGRGCARA